MKNIVYFFRKLHVKLIENASAIKKYAVRWSFIGILASSLVGFIFVISEVGFDTDFIFTDWYNHKIEWIINFLMLMYAIQVLMVFFPGKPSITRVNLYIKIFLLFLLSLHFFDFIQFDLEIEHQSGYKLEWLFNYALIIVIMIRAWSRILGNVYKNKISSEKLFIFSFLILIIIGTLLLMLPVSTNRIITFTDALFTSTSAVCVTGLSTLDVSSHFTWFGKTVIMVLMQLGGIGVMTFTSFLATAGRSSHSLSEGNAVTSMIAGANKRKLFSALYSVIFVIFVIESLGIMLIYLQLPESAFSDNISRFFFSMFHAVSAFCNAGFSTVSNGMMNDIFKDAWGIQLTMAGLIILGGLGFFIIINYMDRFALMMRNFVKHTILGKEKKYEPHLVNINSIIVVRTTVILILVGTILFFIFESDNLLKDFSLSGKIYTSFFSVVTARTAGFSTIDYGSIMVPTAMLVIMLMWIGASPGSTGGGIKTTTFAVAILTAFSLGRGKSVTHFQNRQISYQTSRKALVVILFSIMAAFIGAMLMAWFERDVNFEKLLFEVFSAVGTVGLSMNLTPLLSEYSKYVLITLMFLGRIGFITVFAAFVRKTRYLLYNYPEDEIYI